MSELEQKIQKSLERVRDEYTQLDVNLKNQKWITNKIKEYLGELGSSFGYEISSSFHNQEWLYDVVWYKNNENNILEKTILVVESELSNRSINSLKYDFEKLLLSNSDLRVMICFGQGNFNFPQNVNGIIESFNNYVTTYQNLNSGDRILILVWDDYMTGEVYPHLIIK
ncbi:MAG TPA: hypothetical protein PKO18_05155 [Chitinophagales bacterium]|nr:hypothetical protein [Chitinophagales bacterium]